MFLTYFETKGSHPYQLLESKVVFTVPLQVFLSLLNDDDVDLPDNQLYTLSSFFNLMAATYDELEKIVDDFRKNDEDEDDNLHILKDSHTITPDDLLLHLGTTEQAIAFLTVAWHIVEDPNLTQITYDPAWRPSGKTTYLAQMAQSILMPNDFSPWGRLAITRRSPFGTPPLSLGSSNEPKTNGYQDDFLLTELAELSPVISTYFDSNQAQKYMVSAVARMWIETQFNGLITNPFPEFDFDEPNQNSLLLQAGDETWVPLLQSAIASSRYRQEARVADVITNSFHISLLTALEFLLNDTISDLELPDENSYEVGADNTGSDWDGTGNSPDYDDGDDDDDGDNEIEISF